MILLISSVTCGERYCPVILSNGDFSIFLMMEQSHSKVVGKVLPICKMFVKLASPPTVWALCTQPDMDLILSQTSGLSSKLLVALYASLKTAHLKLN